MLLFLAQAAERTLEKVGDKSIDAVNDMGPTLPLVIAPIGAILFALLVFFILRKMGGTH